MSQGPRTRPISRKSAAGCHDGSIRIWNIQEGAIVHTLTGHSDVVGHIAYSPVGHLLASCSLDKTIKMWDTSSGANLHTLLGHTKHALRVAWSPDGLQLASTQNDVDDKMIRLWSATTGKLEQERIVDSKLVIGFAYAPVGRQLTFGAYFDVMQLDPQADTGHNVLGSHTGPVFDVAYSPGGHLVATASGDGTVKIWDSYTGALKCTLSGHAGGVMTVLFLNELEVLAVGQDFTVRFWPLKKTAVENGMMDDGPLSSALAHKGPASAGYFSGKTLTSLGSENSIREWDIETGLSTDLFKSQKIITGVTMSPDQNQIMVNEGDGYRTYDRTEGSNLWTTSEKSKTTVIFATYSPCGRWAALGEEDGRVRLLNRIEGEEELELTKFKDPVALLRFSKCGRLLFSCSKSQENQLSDTETRLPVKFGIPNVHTVQSSPCSTIMAWSSMPVPGDDIGWKGENVGLVHLLDLESGDEVAVLRGHHTIIIRIAWILPDWIATNSADRSVKVWRKGAAAVNSGWTCVATLQDFMGGAITIDWNPISTPELVTGTFDSSICIWRLKEDDSGKVQVTLKWRSTGRFRLIATDTKIADAIDLDKEHRRLLRQHKAIDRSAALDLQQKLIDFIGLYGLMEDAVRTMTRDLGGVDTFTPNDLDEELRRLVQQDQQIKVNESDMSGLEEELQRLVQEQVALDASLRRILNQVREADDKDHPNFHSAISTLLQRLGRQASPR